jgi:hypothetical protein
MNWRIIAAIGCRLLGLWVIVQQIARLLALVASASLIGSPQGAPSRAACAGFALVFVYSAVCLGAGVILWRKADWFAQWMAPADLTPLPNAIAPRPLMIVAVAAIGVYLVTVGVAMGTQLLARVVIVTRDGSLQIELESATRRLWVPIVQLLSGWCLIRFAGNIANYALKTGTERERDGAAYDI